MKGRAAEERSKPGELCKTSQKARQERIQGTNLEQKQHRQQADDLYQARNKQGKNVKRVQGGER